MTLDRDLDAIQWRNNNQQCGSNFVNGPHKINNFYMKLLANKPGPGTVVRCAVPFSSHKMKKK